MPDIKVSASGVLKLLANLNVHKACGPDQINSRVLKECKDIIVPFYTRLFQLSIDTGVVPDDWKCSNISPIYKKGERYKPANYRPVALTSITCKLIEHIICHSLMEHLDKNNILYKLQFGFRHGHSCDTQLLQLFQHLAENIHRKLQTDVAIMDFAKAFDTVSHQRLLAKLSWYGVKGKVNNWIGSFLTNRTQRVVVDG